jgi:signal transduction histidine kinase
LFPTAAIRRNLKWKITLGTALLLTVTCSTLSWMFVQQQIYSVTAGLIESGTLLAQQFAKSSRHSLNSRDLTQIHRTMQEILATPQVAYVALLDTERHIEVGYGKDAWAGQFTDTAPLAIRFSLSSLILARLSQHHLASPMITAVTLGDDTPSLSPTARLEFHDLLSIVVGREQPLFFDVAVFVPQTVATKNDPALHLSLENPRETVNDPSTPTDVRPVMVQLGLSTTSLQTIVRDVIWQALLLTTGLLVLSLAGTALLARHITTPLNALTATASRIERGEHPLPVTSPGHDEIGTLTEVFNHMVQSLHLREAELRDLTHSLEDRVRARTAELEEAYAKLRAIDERKSLFVSTASHELRTPLTSIRMNLANLREGVEGPMEPGQRVVLERVEKSLLRLQQLIQKLLDLSRIEMGDLPLTLRPLPLAPLIELAADSLRALAQDKRVPLVTDVPLKLPLVFGDEEKILQVVTNLLHNAIKFSPPDAPVTVTVRLEPEGRISICIVDCGIGILPEERKKIFEPFYRSPRATTKDGGAGLGLTIAKHLVEIQQGRLWVDSIPGKGSSFFFTLPVDEASVMPRA